MHGAENPLMDHLEYRLNDMISLLLAFSWVMMQFHYESIYVDQLSNHLFGKKS